MISCTLTVNFVLSSDDGCADVGQDKKKPLIMPILLGFPYKNMLRWCVNVNDAKNSDSQEIIED